MKIVDNVLQRAATPAYGWLVFFMTVCESTFLFIPPEVFMTPAIVANRRRALPITLAAAAGSFVGGAIGYMIGLWLFDSVGLWIIETFASMETFTMAQTMFTRHGALLILLSAVTPIPYKMMGICAGFMGFPILAFLVISGIFRTLRFAIVGALLWRFQEYANAIVKKYFWPLTIIAILCAITAVGIITLI